MNRARKQPPRSAVRNRAVSKSKGERPVEPEERPPDDSGDRLEAYRAKRDPERTPEPFGPEGETASLSTPRLFVIQKHSARRLHYDLRLEWKGALHSWAVPNSFPIDPKERRIAIEVEDHPMDYANFEGTIPKGNYGAGGVIVWDRGQWVAREGPGEGIEAGKLHFELRGYKLRGTWILVRMKDDPRSWLLMRRLEKGERLPEPIGEESIFSGLTVEEVLRGEDPAVALRAELEALGTSRTFVDPAQCQLMLAGIAPKPFSAPGWIFEIKYDGYRALGSRVHGQASLRSRGGEEMAETFPEIARAVAALPYERVVIDGELVVLNEEGHPSFHALQRRGQSRRPLDAERGARETPATFFAFDLLAVEGFDLRNRPLLERKALLRRVLPPSGPIRYCDHIEELGLEAFERIREMGLEGLVAKRADSLYARRAKRPVAEARDRADRRLRHRRLHGDAQRAPRPEGTRGSLARRPSSRRSGRAGGMGLRRASRHGVHGRRPRGPRARPGARETGQAGLRDPGPRPIGKGLHVDRAGRGRGGQVPLRDRGGDAPGRRLRSPARGQAAGGMRGSGRIPSLVRARRRKPRGRARR